ncbi:hypothetical protein HY634_02520, partial [Candidatus Uhrbacteria bacterium]|nr:hypothetical protein [Candidatus Uhrbacteria bacterium]
MSHLAAHIIAIWKSKGPTSHDVVDAVRRITGERRVGHAGTLDPMAEGVLVVGIGREATKRLSTEVAKEKEYRATIRLGATSTTDDAEGEIQAHDLAKFQNPKSKCQTNPKIQNPNRDNIERTLRQFVGQIQQVPPAYSAVKLKGTPAYKLARQGHVVDLKPRTVEMKEIELLEYTPPLAPP